VVVKLTLSSPANFIECLVHQGHDVEPLKDNCNFGKSFVHCPKKRTAHIHGNGLEGLCPFLQFPEKGYDSVFGCSLDCMDDAATGQVNKDGHVAVAFTDTELINIKSRNTGDLDGAVQLFQQLFSWKALGVDIRGRSRTLRVNYRTSHRIRIQADRLLEPELSDVDGNTETRGGTVSVFNGLAPVMKIVMSENDEIRAAADSASFPFKLLNENLKMVNNSASISTMHLAKGIELRVVVMACDDEVLPLQERIESVADDTDLEEVYNTERHQLYVACTCARDQLLVTSVDSAPEFVDDLMG